MDQVGHARVTLVGSSAVDVMLLLLLLRAGGGSSGVDSLREPLKVLRELVLVVFMMVVKLSDSVFGMVIEYCRNS